MQGLFRIVFLVTCCAVTFGYQNSLFAQSKSLSFEHFGKEDGLNQSSVNCIFQDHLDFLWIANFGGVNKFDGYDFTSYENDFDNQNSIADNSVWVIYERKDKTLWFGTKSGLSLYSRGEDNFQNYTIKTKREASKTLAVKALFEDASGRFYVGSEGEGLFVFNAKTKKFQRETLIPNSARVSAITEDSFGNLWVGTENFGLFRINNERNKVTDFYSNSTFSSETIWSLYSDNYGDVWIGTDRDGLVRFRSKTGSFLHFKNHAESYSYSFGNKIKTIAAGQDGDLWVGSATKGLAYYSKDNNSFSFYEKNEFDKNSPFDNDVSSICFGANNVLYVGYYMKGFDKAIETPFRTMKSDPSSENTLSDNNVYCMFLDQQKQLWMGTFGGGLNKYDIQTGTFTNWRHDENDPYSISHDWVRIIYEDGNGALWIGTWGGGLNKLDRKTGQFKRYLTGEENGLSFSIVTALYEDDDGELWVGTYGGGINIYQPETDDFRYFVHEKDNANSLSDDHITSFHQDESGLIWICTYGGGLNSYNKDSKEFLRYLPNTSKKDGLNTYKPLHIYREKDQNFFWITTLGGGLNRFNYKENSFSHFTEKDGLANNSTMGMLKDEDGHYWISSNNGISRFNPNQNSFVNYTTRDGLAGDDFNLEAYAKTKNGTMFFGGKNGVTFFNPRDIAYENEFPKVGFISIQVEDSMYLNYSMTIELMYKEHLSIDFAAINADKTKNIEYAYMLTGLDADWRLIKGLRHLEFSTLEPGEYELRVKSTNGNKVWNDDFITLNIVVTPPWYMTWTFRILVGALILLTIFTYYFIRLRRIREQNRILEVKVKDRTKTIEEKNVALGEEKEKTDKAYKQLKKLEGFKEDLVSMIVHDLKNPLVTILNYSSTKEADSELKSINKSGNLMLDLIENMLEIQKFENTEVNLELTERALVAVINDAVRHVEVLAEDKRILIRVDVNECFRVSIDESVIQRVMINLLSNAIKFSDTDSEIEVFARVNPSDKKQIVVEVKDHGQGIPKETVSTIFDKYVQAEAKKSGNIRSTGLGLTFCRMAVQSHMGKIWAESELGVGSSFLFTIPRLEDKSTSRTQGATEITPDNTSELYQLSLSLVERGEIRSLCPNLDDLSMYEMGEWLSLFENLEHSNSSHVMQWKELMQTALINFDEKAFLHLKKLTETQ